jgi:hypothetical protein
LSHDISNLFEFIAWSPVDSLILLFFPFDISYDLQIGFVESEEERVDEAKLLLGVSVVGTRDWMVMLLRYKLGYHCVNSLKVL